MPGSVASRILYIKQLLLEEGVCIVYDSGNDAGDNKEHTRRMRNILGVYVSIVCDRHAFKEQWFATRSSSSYFHSVEGVVSSQNPLL
jgi:hypothetical protein